MITETVQRIVDVSSEDFRAAAKKEQQLRYVSCSLNSKFNVEVTQVAEI